MSAAEKAAGSRRRAGRRRGEAHGDRGAKPPVWPGVRGGRYRPLSDTATQQVHVSALNLLETIGMSDAPEFVLRRLQARGARLTDAGRVLFPRALVEDAIAGLRRDLVLHGQRPGCELELAPSRVYVGSGGAAPRMVDLDDGSYRPALLRDLYDAARLVDALDNVHFFSRSVVATDMPGERELDINTAFACLAGTAKHVMVSASRREHVAAIAAMGATVAGSPEAFAAQPILSLNINHVVPPMRFIAESCAVMEQAALLGVPLFVNSTDQAGASSPASLAGSVVQAVAETMAGMVFCWLVNPRCMAVFGPRPLIADLRTGGMTGGCGEQAVAMAAGVQMAQFYGLSNSCIAGATDSKIPDAQSGYEKALTVALAAHAGANMVTQACGMHAALMGCCLESYVIDDDMLGAVLRSVRGIETDDIAACEQVVADVVRGDGHYLGNPDTMARMQSDYLYPVLADRRSPDEWEEGGAPDIRGPARERAREILARHFPTHLPAAVQAELRRAQPIYLAPDAMGGA